MKAKLSDDQFRAVVAESLSVAQVIVRLGLVPAGGNYKTVQTRVDALGIDTSHFTGSGWNVGERFQRFGKCTETAELLIKNSAYHFTHGLKNGVICLFRWNFIIAMVLIMTIV